MNDHLDMTALAFRLLDQAMAAQPSEPDEPDQSCTICGRGVDPLRGTRTCSDRCARKDNEQAQYDECDDVAGWSGEPEKGPSDAN